jgi:hypothetical protein
VGSRFIDSREVTVRITDLATRDGKTNKWRAHTESDPATGKLRHLIYHYSTLMLSYYVEVDSEYPKRYRWDGDPYGVDAYLGWGSVSDQGGMNDLFKELGMPLYFSRKGGAQIYSTVYDPHGGPNQGQCHLPRWVHPDTGQCEHPDHDNRIALTNRG